MQLLQCGKGVIQHVPWVYSWNGITDVCSKSSHNLANQAETFANFSISIINVISSELSSTDAPSHA